MWTNEHIADYIVHEGLDYAIQNIDPEKVVDPNVRVMIKECQILLDNIAKAVDLENHPEY